MAGPGQHQVGGQHRGSGADSGSRPDELEALCSSLRCEETPSALQCLGRLWAGLFYPGDAPREWATLPQAWAKGKLSGSSRTIRRTEDPTRAPILSRQSRIVET